MIPETSRRRLDRRLPLNEWLPLKPLVSVDDPLPRRGCPNCRGELYAIEPEYWECGNCHQRWFRSGLHRKKRKATP